MDTACLHNLFLDHESSDIQLRIHACDQDSEVVLPAHSLVLRFASKVFRTMLESAKFKESWTGIVELKVKGDTDDAIFFLRYLYTRNLEHVDMNVYISLLHTAHLYEVDDLVRLCSERVVEKLNPLTVCKTYSSLINVATPNLLNHCKNIMLEFAFLIFKKDLHFSVDEQTMIFLLSSDKLNVLDEEQALGALWRWGCAHLALDKCPEKSVEMYIEKLLPFIRKSLIKTVHEGSPLFRLWTYWKTDTEKSESLKTSAKTRESEMPNCLRRFSEVIDISKFSEQYQAEIVKTSDNCLMLFSVNREILLSGFSVHINVVEKSEQLTSGNMFQFYLTQEDVLQLGTPEIVLVKEYTSPRAQFNTQEARKDNPQSFQPTSFMFAGVDKSFVVQPKPEPRYEQRYVYRLTINLQKPIVLKPTEPIHLNLSIKPMPITEVCLTARTFSPNTSLNLEQNLKVLLWNQSVAVRHLYYFIN